MCKQYILLQFGTHRCQHYLPGLSLVCIRGKEVHLPMQVKHKKDTLRWQMGVVHADDTDHTSDSGNKHTVCSCKSKWSSRHTLPGNARLQ